MSERHAPPVGTPTAMRRVLMITCDFPPSPAVASELCAQLARHLPGYGWEPIVLTLPEHYSPDGDRSATRRYSGHVIRMPAIPHPFAVYRHIKASLGGVLVPQRRGGTIGPSPAPGATANGGQPKGRIRRTVVSVLGLPDEYTGWIVPAVLAGMSAIRRDRIEHILSISSHSTGHLVGLCLSGLTGVSWTAHFQDPWSHPYEPWRDSERVTAASERVVRWMERAVMRRADAVACVTDAHTDWLRQSYPELSPDKFVTIPNGFDGDEWERLERSGLRPHRRDTFVITYAGTLYPWQSPLPLFRALRALIDGGAIEPECVRVEFFGYCDEARVAAMVRQCGLIGCVNVGRPVGRAEALTRIAQSDLLLLLAETLTLQIPSKTFDYLRAGRPILAFVPPSKRVLTDLLERTGGAWVVDPDDAEALTTTLAEAYKSWRDGRTGPRSCPDVIASFDRRVLTGRFADLFMTAGGLREVGPTLRSALRHLPRSAN